MSLQLDNGKLGLQIPDFDPNTPLGRARQQLELVPVYDFGYIMPAFEKCYKKFDYYAFNEIDIETWKLIIWELEKMKQYLSDNPNPHSLKDVLGFLFVNSEEEFLENYDTNFKQLISMITEFQSWINEKSVSAKFISVLGM